MAMLFDDHDVHDDWNTSQSWVEEMRAKPWWEERIAAALVSYWVYQHLGNLSPEELRESELLAPGQARTPTTPARCCTTWACRADEQVDGSRWSYARDLGRTRLVMLDSREGRVLDARDRRDGRRRRVGVDRGAARPATVDHLLLADTLPMFFSPAFHHAEAWNEAVAGGRLGAADGARRARRRAARSTSSTGRRSTTRSGAMCDLVCAVSAGERGDAAGVDRDARRRRPPRLCRRASTPAAQQRGLAGGLLAVPQPAAEDRAAPGAAGVLAAAGAGRARARARAPGCPTRRCDWTVTDGPFFDNQVATLDIDGRSATLRVERTTDGGWRHPRLTTSLERRLV